MGVAEQDDEVGFGEQGLEGFADARERGTSWTMSFTVASTADEGGSGFEVGIAGLFGFGLHGAAGELGFPLHPIAEAFEFGQVEAAGAHFGPLGEEVDRLEVGGEAVGAAVLGVEVYELAGFAGVLRDRLQAEVADEVGDEALLVLDLHAVEDAAIGVDGTRKSCLRWKLARGSATVRTGRKRVGNGKSYTIASRGTVGNGKRQRRRRVADVSVQRTLEAPDCMATRRRGQKKPGCWPGFVVSGRLVCRGYITSEIGVEDSFSPSTTSRRAWRTAGWCSQSIPDCSSSMNDWGERSPCCQGSLSICS